VRIRDKFKRLTLWNKIGVLGALASILGLFCAFVPLLFQDSPLVESREETHITDMTGWWRLALVIESSSYAPYKGLRVAYKVHVLQDGNRIEGRGEKWWENDRELPYSQHDPIEIKGTVDGLTCTLGYALKGRQRTTSGSFVFDVSSGAPPYEGTFSGTGADVHGSATLMPLTECPSIRG